MMVGTTHFTNALVQRKNLSKVGVVRLCGPSTVSFPPFIEFPPDISDSLFFLLFLMMIIVNISLIQKQKFSGILNVSRVGFISTASQSIKNHRSRDTGGERK